MEKRKKASEGLRRKSQLNKERMKSLLGSSPIGYSGGYSEIIR